jgi:hypothetical protein
MKAYPSSIEAEEFVSKHGEAMAQNIGYYCAAAGKRVTVLLEEQNALPPNVDLSGILQVLLSLRATIELNAVERRFGKAARDGLQSAMDKYFNAVGVCRGPFVTWVNAAEQTMAASTRPADWLRIHAVNLLDTRDPDDEVFHLLLGEGFAEGASLVDVIVENA